MADYRGDRSRSPAASGAPERKPYFEDRPRRRERTPPPPSNSIGVFGLSYDTSEDTLRELFTGFGEIERLVILTDRETGKSRGFGFITFDSVENATGAKEKLNGQEVDGRNIRVDFSHGKRERRDGGGGGGGGYERRGPRDGGSGGYRPRRDDGERRSYRRDDDRGGYSSSRREERY